MAPPATRRTLAADDASWTCDLRAPIGFSFGFASPYRVRRTSGCGLVRFERLDPHARDVAYDASNGELVGAYREDDVGTQLVGTTCFAAEYVAGVWPVPACADETVAVCRGASECPRRVSSELAATPELGPIAGALGFGLWLAPFQDRFVCDVDPSSLPAAAPMPAGYVTTRTTGCGAVTFAASTDIWTWAGVFDAATGEIVGASSVDDIPAALESSGCTDTNIVVGAYPAPSCGSNVVRYCKPAY